MMHSSGQTLNDRLNAARYALAGQGLARVVCKATTEEMIAPKKKHIDYLLQCTNEPNVSIPQMANLLIERTSHSSWVVVFKALITVHHLMCYGNERFTQYLASSNSFKLQLSNYLDKSGPKSYDMSIYIRRYAKYLNAKALSYRAVAFDFTKIKRGPDGPLRSLSVEKLLKHLPVLQSQIDTLLEFECTPADLTNSVINAAFFLLFKDLIRLFASYNDAIINTLEKFFEMTNKKQARDALDNYKKFLIRMNKVSDFLKVAENAGIDKGEIPDLAKAPSSLLDAMEQHMAMLEGKGKVSSSTANANGNTDDTTTAKKAIEEEEKFLNKLKTDTSEHSEMHMREKSSGSSGTSSATSNPFLAFAASIPEPSAANESSSGQSKSGNNDIIDLFATDSTTTSKTEKKKDANADLFALGSDDASSSSNPFADILSAMNTTTTALTANTANTVGQDTNFATSDNFAAAFGSSSNSNIVNSTVIPKDTKAKSPTEDVSQDAKSSSHGFDAFGDVLQPQNVSSIGQGQKSNNSTTTTAVLTTNNNSNNTTVPSSLNSQNIQKGDIDSYLASLAQNLDINGPKNDLKKGQQLFNQSPKSNMKTGGPAASASLGTTSPVSHMMPISSAPMVATPGFGWTSSMMTSNMAFTPANATVSRPGLMPIIPIAVQPSIIMSNVPSTLPTAYGIGGHLTSPRPASMMPNAVPVLPPGVTSATLATALSSKSSSPNNNTNTANNGISSLSQADPFGAL